LNQLEKMVQIRRASWYVRELSSGPLQLSKIPRACQINELQSIDDEQWRARGVPEIIEQRQPSTRREQSTASFFVLLKRAEPRFLLGETIEFLQLIILNTSGGHHQSVSSKENKTKSTTVSGLSHLSHRLKPE
jgi:hypothetical protein